MPQTAGEWTAFVLVLVFFAFLLFLGALVARDTIRRKGRWGINLRVPDCPRCGEWLSPARVPRSFKQALWGGCTCPRCGCELDKWGVPIEGAGERSRFPDAGKTVQRERKSRGKRSGEKSDA